MKGLESGSISTLGPAVSSPWALQVVYDVTDALIARGIAVELAWVKRHALSEGNRLADSAAAEGAEMEAMERKRKFVRRKEVPELIAMMGIDSIEEWYWRANKELLLLGEEEAPSDVESDGSSSGSAEMDISDDDEDDE